MARKIKLDDLAKVLTDLEQFDHARDGAGEHTAKEIKKLLPEFADLANREERVLDAQIYNALKPYVEAATKDGASPSAQKKLITAAESIEELDGIEDITALKARFVEAEKNLKDLGIDSESLGKLKTLQAKLASPFGMVQTEGVSKAAEHHLTKWEGRTWQGFGRCAGTALCAVGLADGIFRAKTDNGEDRNVATRFGEVALCAIGAAALVLAGKAHGAQALKV